MIFAEQTNRQTDGKWVDNKTERLNRDNAERERVIPKKKENTIKPNNSIDES